MRGASVKNKPQNVRITEVVDNLVSNNSQLPLSAKMGKKLQDEKEATANKTAAFSETPGNIKIPTEKLVKDSLDLKEDKANKTESFSVTPAQIKYPTEKLVKDSLDAKMGIMTILEAAPVNAVASQGLLTISGVVIEGETVTIGDEIYEITAGGELSDAAHIEVDITGAASIEYAQGTLTLDTQPAVDDTMTIGSTVYTFVLDDKETPIAGDIKIGADLAGAKANVIAAIKGTDAWNTAHATVDCADEWAIDDLVLTAITAGVAGNSIATTETFTAVTNIFDAVTLGTTTAGVDALNTEVGPLLEAVIDAESALVSASDAAGAVTVTALVAGVAGDTIALDESMANGVWDAVFMGTARAGVDGTVGVKGQYYYHNNVLYFPIDTQTIADANWKKFTVESA